MTIIIYYYYRRRRRRPIALATAAVVGSGQLLLSLRPYTGYALNTAAVASPSRRWA